MRKCVNWLFVAGAGLVLVVAVIIFYYAILPILVRKQVSKTMALNNGTDAWDRFVKLPIAIHFSVYFFNLVNLDEVLQGEKPIVKEVGPWVYKETREKFNLELNDEKDTVKYQEKAFFEFDAEASKPLTVNDYVQPANIIIQVVNTISERMPSLNFVNELLELGFPELLRDNYAMRLNRTVDELLFSGITTHCPPNASLSAITVCSILRHFPGLKSLQKYPNGDMNVGIMRFKNDTLSDTYEVYRGNHDFDKIGQIVTLNGQPSVDNWFGDECNKVAGSYGETLLKPFLTEDSTMKVYGSDLCSSLPMGFKETSSYKGVDSFKFGPQKKFLGSVVDYPENYCYCPGSIDGITLGQGCMKAGAMEFSACQAVPVVLSFPHFYKASSHFQNAVGGLDPDSDKHESYIQLEPITGIPLKGVKRIQINFQMKGTPAMKITKNARDTLIPFLWVEEVAALGDDQVNLLKDMLLKMLKILSIVRWVLIAVGSLMVLVGCVMSFLSARKEHRHQY